MNRTVFRSSGTVVPPDVTHAMRRAGICELTKDARASCSEWAALFMDAREWKTVKSVLVNNPLTPPPCYDTLTAHSTGQSRWRKCGGLEVFTVQNPLAVTSSQMPPSGSAGGGKRAADASGNGGGKRIKASYVHAKIAGKTSQLGPGMRGLLITCDVHMEKAAIRETFGLLDELMESEAGEATPSVPLPTSSQPPAVTATAGDSLAAELAALQRGGGPAPAGGPADGQPKRRYSIAHTGCPGSVFVKLDDASLDPTGLVDRAMARALATGHSGARHVVRMVPVQACVPARSAASIADGVKSFTHAALRGFVGTYAVQWRRRNNNSLDKMSVIDAVASEVAAVAPEASVDLRNAEAAVSVEVIATTGLVSVLTRWREFRQYNLRACAGAGGDDATAAAQPEPEPSAYATACASTSSTKE